MAARAHRRKLVGTIRLATATSSLVALLGAALASALVIDDFEAGPFSVSGNSDSCELATPCNDTQTGLPLGAVLGGERAVSVLAGSPGGEAATATLSLSAGSDAAVVTAGSIALFDYAAFPSPFDITQAGANVGFRIEIASASGSGDASVFVDTGEAVITIVAAPIAEPGGLFLPFSELPGQPDLTQVDRLTLVISVFEAAEISVDSFQAVPETSTSLLIAAGFLAIVSSRKILRRRSRRSTKTRVLGGFRHALR